MTSAGPRLLAASVALACALAVAPAAAEERKGSWEAGAFYGSSFYSNEFHISNAADAGVRIGWNFRPAYEIEVQYHLTDDSDIETPESTLLASSIPFFAEPDRTFRSKAYTARFLINPRNERRRFKPYVAFGLGRLQFTADPALDSDERGDLRAKILTLGGGARMRLTPHMALRAEIEVEYAPVEIFHNDQVNVGLTWVFGGGRPGDADGDGVLDLNDRCPDTPKGAIVYTGKGSRPGVEGCPWDPDGDGIMDGIDTCADTPRGWPVDEKGCPLDTDGDAVADGIDKSPDTPKGAVVDAEGAPLDRDGDQIFDGIDRCPGTPAGATVDPADGANPGCPRDTDKDGVYDGIDTCPTTPEGATVDAKGCPHDSDGDRVLDGIDQCPDSPKAAKLDKEGCPRVRLDKPEPQVLQNVKFLRGIELYPGTEAWLDLLVEAMTYWPDLVVEIGAYTDDTGGPQANRNVSLRRAEVVKEWMTRRGIEPRRLVARGYGATNFVADNATEEGRETNRRIEVKRLSGSLRKHARPVEDEQPATPAAPAPESAAPEPGLAPAPAAPAPAPGTAPAPQPSAPAPPAPAPSAPAPEPSPSPTPPPAPGPEPPQPTPSPEPAPQAPAGA